MRMIKIGGAKASVAGWSEKPTCRQVDSVVLTRTNLTRNSVCGFVFEEDFTDKFSASLCFRALRRFLDLSGSPGRASCSDGEIFVSTHPLIYASFAKYKHFFRKVWALRS